MPVSAHRSGGNTTKGPAISTDQILRIFNARYGSDTAKGLPKVAIAGALAAEVSFSAMSRCTILRRYRTATTYHVE